MKWAVFLVLLAMSASPADVSATTSPASAGEVEFQQLFRSWQERRARPSPVPSGISRRRPDKHVAKLSVSSPMGMRINPITGRRMLHAGADLIASWGAAIRVTADGVVKQAGPVGSYGMMVTVRHSGGYETRYAHMSRILVTPGEQVRKGDLIGQVGSTGRSTGPHLHYEIRRFGSAIDPLPSIIR